MTGVFSVLKCVHFKYLKNVVFMNVYVCELQLVNMKGDCTCMCMPVLRVYVYVCVCVCVHDC